MRAGEYGVGAGRLVGWPSALGLCLLVAFCGAAAFLAGCDPIQRYRVLSFFFDGVPRPPGVAADPNDVEPGTDTFAFDPDSPLGRAIREGRVKDPTTAASQPADLVMHEPYKKRQCDRCHDRQASFDVPVSGGICQKCHAAYYELKRDDWVHGPVALGLCSYCHLPHESEQKTLLRKPQEDLCFGCHNQRPLLAEAHHAQAGKGKTPCGTCHDPHSAGNTLLLVDSTTYVRRQARAVSLPSPHDNWQKKDCVLCHSPEQSNRLADKATVNRQCVACHEKARQALPDRKLHKAVTDGDCVACHTPHRSPRPNLIRPEAEKVCLGCHDLRKIIKGEHPRIVRGECLLCHKGHASAYKNLLRWPELPVRGQPGQPPTQPARAGQ